MRRVIVAALLLAAGVGVGYAIRGKSARGTAEAPDQPEPQSQPAAPTLAEVLAALPRPEPRRGDGAITGRVLTKDKAPVPGVRVRAVPEDIFGSYWEPGEPPPPEELDQYVRRLVEEYWRERQDTVRTTSGEDGSFALRGLAPDLNYLVMFEHPGYELLADETRVRPGADIDVVAEPAVGLVLAPTLPDGTVPSEGRVACRSETGTITWRWNSWRNSVHLDPGSWHIVFEAEQGGRPYRGEADVDLVQGAQPSPVSLSLQSRTGIEGVLRYTSGHRYAVLAIRTVRLEGDEDPVAALSSDRASRERWPRDDTEYRILDLSPGRYAVGVFLRDILLAHRAVDVGDGALAKGDLEVGGIPPGTCVVVHALGPDGKPIEKGEFQTAYIPPNGGGSGGSTIAVPCDDGTFWVPHYDPRGAPPGGTYVVCVSCEFGCKEAHYDPTKTREVEIRFEAASSVTVALENFEKRQADMLEVALKPAAPDPDVFFGRYDLDRVRPDAEGAVELTAVEPGSYVLRLVVTYGNDGRLQAVRREVDVETGANRIAIAVPEFHRLTLHIDEPRIEGEQIGLCALGDEEGRYRCFERLDAEGTVVFERVPAGRFVAFRGMRGDEYMKVDVPSDGAVRWKAASEPIGRGR